MTYSRRRVLARAVGATAGVSGLSGTLASEAPRRFETLSVSVTGPGSLWVGTLGFRTGEGEERWEDLFGFGALDYVAPRDFEVHENVAALYTPVRFVAAPMAGHDPANPLKATLSAGGSRLATEAVESVDDAITLTLE